MEARKIIFILTDETDQRSIMSSATTLVELKRDMSEANINYYDKVFHEGNSRVTLEEDSAILPTNIPDRRTGNITNDLIFMLTTKKSKISSGGVDRKAIFAKIRELGLWESVIKHFGKNATQVKTNLLLEYLDGNTKSSDESCTSEEVGNIDSIAANDGVTEPSADRPKTLKDLVANLAGVVKFVCASLSDRGTDELGYCVVVLDEILADLSSLPSAGDSSENEAELSRNVVKNMFNWVNY